MGYFAVNLFKTFKRTYCQSVNKEVMKYLCVAEKNDAAKNIAQFLSRGSSSRREGLSVYNKIYEFDSQVMGQQVKMVMTSVSGHLLNYAFANQFKGWKSCNPVALFDAPVLKVCSEDFINIKKTLEREIRYCSGLIIWTDCDREGENIGFEIIHVCREVKPNLTVYRAKFSEITSPSVHRALNNLDRPNQGVSDAVDVRTELDLRTGAAFTRLQTLRLQKVFPGVLTNKLISYGSCQFPTLGFVVDRYKALEDFIPERFWKIKMNHRVKELTTDFLWKRERLFEKGAVEAILDICQENSLATIENVDGRPKNKWRPLPLDTVEMEKNISKKLRINAKETMKIAEKLYTQGLISYPRTETNIFPKELNLNSLVEQQKDDSRWGNFANRILDNGGANPRQGKKSDQAHPPIHPTKYASNLEGSEQRVYEYIVRHFLACVSKDAVGHETTVDADVAGEKFTAKGLVVLERNYLEVYIYEKWNAKEINEYQRGDTFTPTELDMVEGSTSPPKLLTESELIALMEKHGIGTDATHSEHIETIKSREYVGLHENMYFMPSNLGMGLVEGYNRIGLEISLAKPNLRAEFETDLKGICEGRKSAEVVRTEQIRKYREVFELVAERMRLIDDSLSNRLSSRPEAYTEDTSGFDDHRPVLRCPKCGSDMILKNRRNGTGKFLSCTKYPNCKHALWFGSGVTSIEITNDTCRVCGPNVRKVKIHFRQNPFLGEPNPNVLCIAGCDAAVLAAMDISLASVSQQNLPPPSRQQAATNVSSTATSSRTTNSTLSNQTTNNTLSNRTLNNTSAAHSNTSSNRTNSDSGFQSNSNTTLRNSDSDWNRNSNQGNWGNSNQSNRGNSNQNSSDAGRTVPSDDTIVCHCEKPGLSLTVRKDGPNQGRNFYKCPDGTCNFFLWASDEGGGPSTSTSNATNQQRDGEIQCNCYLPSVLRTVSKEGPNKGRQFYCCSKPMGQGCKFFKWADEDNDGNDGWGGGGGGGGGGGDGNDGGGGRGRNWNNKYKGKAKTKAPPRNAPYKKQTRGKRKCGICGEEGHTRNKCPRT